MPLTNGSTPTLVNTTTADNQSFSTVADLPGVGYVVIWQGPGYNPNNSQEVGLYGQTYNYDGTKIGGEFVVSGNFPTGSKFDADVIGGPGATFTITWTSFDSSSTGIYMKTLFLNGAGSSPEVQVNDPAMGGSQELSQVVRLSNGNIAVIWQSSGSNPGETGIFARLYDSSHQPLGGQFQVNSSATGLSAAPSLTATLGGGFVSVWSGAGANGDSEIYLQLVDNNGAKVGGEILVNTAGMGAERNPVITTLANGTYMVAWDVGLPGQTGTEIFAQRFGLNGEKIGDQIHVTSGEFTGSRPAIAATPDGGFAVTYQANFQTMLRTFDQYGNAGDPWPIAEDVPILQSRPDIALLGDGSFIVSFHNGDVFTERFRVVDYLTEGNDRAMGTGFSDYLEGFGGDDILRGGDGDDILAGGLGADRMIGGAGRDEVTYANALSGVSLNLLTGGHSGEAQGDKFEEIEQFSLTRFADRFIGGDANDVVYGLEGDDNLAGGKGFDYLDGGDGNDVLEGGGDSGDVFNGGDGVDEVTYIHENFGLAVDFEAGRFAGAALGDSFISIEKFTLTRFGDEFNGTDAVERVAGGIGDDRLSGRGGDDVLDGNDGNDVLIGGTGADQMSGGFGDDTFYVDSAADRVIDGKGQGNDRVATSVSYTLAAGAEIETLEMVNSTATDLATLTGNEFANRLIGSAGINYLIGGGGADVMLGLGGNDVYYVDANDVVSEMAGGGNDRIAAMTSYTLAAGSEVETVEAVNITGTEMINLIGNEFAQRLIGNAASNYFIGGGGGDVMIGANGNDTYYVDFGDTVEEYAGGGADRVAAMSSFTLTNSAEVELIEAVNQNAADGFSLIGNAFAQTIAGNAGANLIDGRGGADVLMGFGGADTFAFTTAIGAGNVDNIRDFVHGTDKIALDDAVFTQIGGLGALGADAFTTGTAAADAGDRIVYNNATGELFYDADGSGAGAAVLFATLNGTPVLSASDFMVI